MFELNSVRLQKIKRKNKRVRIQKKVDREKPMTICIAAIAEASTPYPKIIIAADREVSIPDWISYTSGVGKIRVLTPYCCAMISTSNALVCQDIVTKTIDEITEILRDYPDKKLKIEQITEMLSKKFKDLLITQREAAILSPHGLTYDSYVARSKEFSREHIEIITDDLKNYESQIYSASFSAEILVCGIDNKPHIFAVTQTGQYASFDSDGFAISGSGKATALPEFTKYPYDPKGHWLYALHRVYTSKKVAERVGGVGPDTDLVVMHLSGEGVSFWGADGDTQKLLDSGMKTVKKSEIAIYEDLLKRFNDLLARQENKK